MSWGAIRKSFHWNKQHAMEVRKNESSYLSPKLRLPLQVTAVHSYMRETNSKGNTPCLGRSLHGPSVVQVLPKPSSGE